MSLKTPRGRVSYPHLYQPRKFNPTALAKYQLTLIFDDDADLSAILAAIEEAVDKEWPNKRPKKLKNPILVGDDEENIDEFKKRFIRLNSTMKPQVVDYDLEPIAEDDKEGVYPGCWGRASIGVRAYDMETGSGVALYLNNFQKLADGEPLAFKQKSADEDFGDDDGECEV